MKYLDAETMLAASRGADADAVAQRLSKDHAHGPGHGHGDHMGIVGDMDGFDEAKVVDAVVEGQAIPKTEPSGHRIHMRLIQRPQMTTLALPSSATWPSEAIPPLTAPWYFLPDVLSYSRFMMASPDYMLAELQRELGELKREWDMLRGDDLGRGFVQAAREKVERQIGKVNAELMTDMVKKSERDSREMWREAVGGLRQERERKRERERRAQDREAIPADEIPPMAQAQANLDHKPNPNVDIPPNLPVEPNPMPSPSPSGPSRKSRRRGAAHSAPQIPSGPSYWFYQSSLGASVYLHPLDIRILLAHFKSYSLFPPTLSFTSTGFDPGTINDELRKRCKYLSHLPTGTEVIFVEADLEEIVGKEGLAAFDQPLKARREKRRARVKREDRAKSKWEQAEREKLPVAATRTPAEDREFALALAHSIPVVQWENEPILGQAGSVGSSSYASPGTSPTSGWAHAHTQPGVPATRSFASTLTSTRQRASTTDTRRLNREDEWQVDVAWEAFGDLHVRDREADADENKQEKDAPPSTGKKGKKGGKKTTLVLGGGGGRRA